jgi:general secretion pathway protein D
MKKVILIVLSATATLSVALFINDGFMARPVLAEEGKPAVEPAKPEAVSEKPDGAPEAETEKTAEKADSEKKEEPKKEEEPIDPMDRMEKINLKEMEMKNVIDKLAEWTGKVVIPHPDVLKVKLSAISSEELPRRRVLHIIEMVLKQKGFIMEEEGDLLYLKPSGEAKVKSVPVILPGESLAAIEDQSLRVQWFVTTKNYPPSRLMELLKPMIEGEGVHIAADDTTHSLILIDTVANLLRLEQVIRQLDVPEAELMTSGFIEVKHNDPVEIVQMVRLLMGNAIPGATTTRRQQQSRRYYGRYGGGRQRSQSRTPDMQKGNPLGTGLSGQPMVLFPYKSGQKKYIIARATADDMKVIREWVEMLDTDAPIDSEWETVAVHFADVDEMADKLDYSLQQFSGAEFRLNVVISPLPQAKKVLIFGSKDKRDLVKKFIVEIDIPPEDLETRHFLLKYADPDTIKTNIEELYDQMTSSGGMSYYQMRYALETRYDSDKVRVISFPSLKQITVITTPITMIKIEKQITDWDVPIDVNSVKPDIITLHNSDAVQMANLLSTLFSESESASSNSWRWWDWSPEEKQKIVGPLYGQLTFEAVPDTKKIIVISKIPEAYDVVRDLILELDGQDVAEVPLVVTLKYADAEDLCDQLNALLNEPGTTATLQRSDRGLSYETDFSGNEDQNQNNQNNNQNNQTNPNVITPWWNQSRINADEMPSSNLIGKTRFIPVHRSKAILVLTPPEYEESIQKMIEELDQPGKQVMIKAVLLQVNYDKLHSLGVQYSSNPAALGTVNENALSGLTSLLYAETPGESFSVDSGVSVSVLVDLLKREADGRILNEPTLWTKDNEEAIFFKGRNVPFLEASQTSTEGQSITNTVEYRNVGLTLRVRPNITPENDVDTTINLEISQVESDLVNGNIATSNFETTTHLIVEDGQAIMISGILEQVDAEAVRKVWLLGDIPLVGDLFRHTSIQQTNNKLLAFVTPYVIDNKRPDNEAIDKIDDAIDEMEEIRRKLDKLFLESDDAG